MSAAPTDYPPAVLEEAEQAMVAASSGLEYPSADLAGAQAYADVLARYTVSQRLAADALTDTEPPPVDEDALAEARAYERGLREGRAIGRREAIRDAVLHLRAVELPHIAKRVNENEAYLSATKQGAASS